MLSKFHENFKNAIDRIQSVLDTPEDAYDYEMSVLIRWMLTTDANPYCYLPDGFKGSLYSAQEFEGLISVIHHALYDDGEITFIKVNGEPQITFVWQHEDNFEDLVLTSAEKASRDRGFKVEVEVLDISPAEFPALYEDYHREDIKRCFFHDARRHGVDFAVKHYSKHYKCYDHSWIDEI